MQRFDTIVIGAGLIGSAAARHLSSFGLRVALIGPAEPIPGAAAEVYASHYDQGRLTLRLSKHLLWSRVAQRAIEHYRALEAASGIDFYWPAGCLHVEPISDRRPRIEPTEIATVQAIAAAEGIAYTFYPAGNPDWRMRFPALNFPDDCAMLHEPAPAGVINPRALLRAQLTVATQQGVEIISATVRSVSEGSAGVTVTTEDGATFHGEHVLVAAGAFTNFNQLLPAPIPLKLKSETILLGEVRAADAATLAALPVVTYQIDDPTIDDIYMTPALRYPDGHTYVKMGCNTEADSWPQTLAETQAWFRTGNSDICKPAMVAALQAMLPSTDFLSFTSGRCIVCYTPSGLPVIDAVTRRIFVATGGNGSGAKGSDTLGWLAAGFIYDGRWPAAIERAPFRLADDWQAG